MRFTPARPDPGVIGLLCGLMVLLLSGISDSAESHPRLRRPIALQLADNESHLYVANRDSGSITVIDLGTRAIVSETEIGQRLSDLVSLGQGRFLATDESTHELILLQAAGAEVTVQARLPVAPYPVSIAVSTDGRHGSIASLWTRRLTFVRLEGQALSRVGQLDLPFAPRCQTYVRDNRYLVVADSFRGRLGVVTPPDASTAQATLDGVREFPGHNIRGLGLSANGQMLLVAHQMLNELAHTVRNDVHWGLLMSNDLRWLRLDAVLDDQADLFTGAHMHPLGQAGSATADPSGLAVAPDGTVFVATGGVGEIASGREQDFNLTRLSVGRRPTALVVDRAGEFVYVANMFGESISIVSAAERESIAEIALGPVPELSLVQRGEVLFHDARLSHDGWMSCHSCHTDGHTNSLINDNFSDEGFGAAKQVLSLLGKTGTAPFAWNASSSDLAEQIRKSVVNTMQGRAPNEADVAALVAYIESLPPPPSLDRLRGTQQAAAVERGGALFHKEGCVRCHAPPYYTTPATYDVGLVDKHGNRDFNPPSLLGVGQRGPYFHDNSAATLTDVVQTAGHQLERPLSESEVADLLAFLRSL